MDARRLPNSGGVGGLAPAGARVIGADGSAVVAPRPASRRVRASGPIAAGPLPAQHQGPCPAAVAALLPMPDPAYRTRRVQPAALSSATGSAAGQVRGRAPPVRRRRPLHRRPPPRFDTPNLPARRRRSPAHGRATPPARDGEPAGGPGPEAAARQGAAGGEGCQRRPNPARPLVSPACSPRSRGGGGAVATRGASGLDPC